MNYPYRIFVFMWLIVAVGLHATHTHAANTSLPNSLLTDDYVYEYTFSDFDKAVQIMKELRKRDTYSQYRLDVTEGDLYFNTGRYLQALKYYKRVMESDTVRGSDKEYMEQVHRMISCYDCLHDEAKKANYVRLLLQKAEQCGNKEMKSIALFNMGKMIYYQEDKPRGYEMIKEAISLMKQTDYKYKYDNLRYNYNSLFIMQQRDKRYEDALQTLEELDKVVTEATNGEPGIGNLAEKERKTLYAHRAVVFSRLGRIREADEAYRAWEAIGEAYTKDDYLIIPYLMDRKRYDKVIEMYTPHEVFLYANKDTVNYHMMTVKRSLAKAYEGKGNYKQASRYYEALAILTDSLKAREQQSSAIELATVYETHEREAELHEQTERVKIRNVMLLSSGVVLVILLVLFVKNVQYTRTVREKNVGMAHTIQELLVYRDNLYRTEEELAAQKAENVRLLKAASPASIAVVDKQEDTEREGTEQECEQEESEEVSRIGNVANTEGAGNTGNTAAVSDKELEENAALFCKLDRMVTTERLFTQKDFSREGLMKCIRVDKNRLARILKQNVHTDATEYTNNKRMEYAVVILKEHPEYNIATVAEMCGVSVSSFNRTFKGKYKMTPNDYKRIK